MIVIVCVDNNKGMLFNNRRQSQDKVVTEDIMSIIGESRLLLNKYSSGLFDNTNCNIVVSESFLDEACDNDYCFVEDKHLMQYVSKIKKVICYNWNRDYPSDFKLDLDFADGNLSKIGAIDFKGNSHDKITREVFTI